MRIRSSCGCTAPAAVQGIRQDWCTDVTLMTNENGEITLEGFRGDYVLSADGHEAQFDLTKDTAAQDITLA